MTFNAPDRRSLRPHVTTTVISVGLTLLVMFSTWMLAGKGWLEASGGTARQIAVNTSRLDKLEELQRLNISRAEHNELVTRVTTIETISPTRPELLSLLQSQQSLIEHLSRQLTDLREQVVQVRILLNERTVPASNAQAQENIKRK